eukprot:s528_g8.t1
MDNLERLGATQRWRVMQEEVRKSLPGSVGDDSIRAIAAIRLMISLTKVKTGEEALWMLTHSHRTAEKTDGRQGAADCIQVRRWETRLLPETELRGFVFRGKLTALSQYHCSTTVPMFLERGPDIAKEPPAQNL